MPPRRSHVNSHHGCTQCKQRRVKCDERRPSCGPCQKRQISCIFQSIAPSPYPSPSPVPVLAPTPVPHESSHLPLLDLELLHHWHTSTSQSLAYAQPLKDVLRTVVPQEALSHPFLMHGLLAVSALHLSHTAPDEKRATYEQSAITHNGASLSLCSSQLSNITRDNCNAVFVFTSLVSTFSFAIQKPRLHQSTPNVNNVVEVFRLIQGVTTVVLQSRAWIEEGRMRPLLKLGKVTHSPATREYAQELYTKIQSLDVASLSSTVQTDRENVRAVVEDSLGNLLEHLKLYLDGHDARVVMMWPAVVGGDYLDLLLQGEALAFRVLSYYGTFLKGLAGSWWLEGWGEFLVDLSAKYICQTR